MQDLGGAEQSCCWTSPRVASAPPDTPARSDKGRVALWARGGLGRFRNRPAFTYPDNCHARTSFVCYNLESWSLFHLHEENDILYKWRKKEKMWVKIQRFLERRRGNSRGLCHLSPQFRRGWGHCPQQRCTSVPITEIGPAEELPLSRMPRTGIFKDHSKRLLCKGATPALLRDADNITPFVLISSSFPKETWISTPPSLIDPYSNLWYKVDKETKRERIPKGENKVSLSVETSVCFISISMGDILRRP